MSVQLFIAWALMAFCVSCSNNSGAEMDRFSSTTIPSHSISAKLSGAKAGGPTYQDYAEESQLQSRTTTTTGQNRKPSASLKESRGYFGSQESKPTTGPGATGLDVREEAPFQMSPVSKRDARNTRNQSESVSIIAAIKPAGYSSYLDGSCRYAKTTGSTSHHPSHKYPNIKLRQPETYFCVQYRNLPESRITSTTGDSYYHPILPVGERQIPKDSPIFMPRTTLLKVGDYFEINRSEWMPYVLKDSFTFPKIYLRRTSTLEIPPKAEFSSQLSWSHEKSDFQILQILHAGEYRITIHGLKYKFFGEEKTSMVLGESIVVRHADLSVPEKIQLNTPFTFSLQICPKAMDLLGDKIYIKMHRSRHSQGKLQTEIEEALPLVICDKSSDLADRKKTIEFTMTVKLSNFEKFTDQWYFLAVYGTQLCDNKNRGVSCIEKGEIIDGVLLGKSSPMHLLKEPDNSAYSPKGFLLDTAITFDQIIYYPDVFSGFVPDQRLEVIMENDLVLQSFNSNEGPKSPIVYSYGELEVRLLAPNGQVQMSTIGNVDHFRINRLSFVVPKSIPPGKYYLEIYGPNRKRPIVKSNTAIINVAHTRMIRPRAYDFWKLDDVKDIVFKLPEGFRDLFERFELILYMDQVTSCSSYTEKVPGSRRISTLKISLKKFKERLSYCPDMDYYRLQVIVKSIPLKLMGRRHFFLHLVGYSQPQWEGDDGRTLIAVSDNLAITLNDALQDCPNMVRISKTSILQSRKSTSNQMLQTLFDLDSGLFMLDDETRNELMDKKTILGPNGEHLSVPKTSLELVEQSRSLSTITLPDDWAETDFGRGTNTPIGEPVPPKTPGTSPDDRLSTLEEFCGFEPVGVSGTVSGKR